MRKRLPGGGEGLSFGETLASIRRLFDHVAVLDDVPGDGAGWITREALLDASADPLAALLGRIGERYTKGRRQACAVSFMLRFSWSVGPMIAAHLGLSRSLRYGDYALRFAPGTALQAVCIRDGEVAPAAADPALARRRLLDALIAHTEPVLEAQHRQSRVSRRALWGMVTSIWAAQFVEVGERLGDVEAGRREAEALFGLVPKIGAVAPRLYSVASGKQRGVCQVRSACCLSHQRPQGRHCLVCPLLPDSERKERSQQWVANRAPVRVLAPAVAPALRSRGTRTLGSALSSGAIRR